MIRGHNEVTCCGDILTKMTRKHRKTADWTAGEVGIVLKLSASLSVSKKTGWFRSLLTSALTQDVTLDVGHLLLVLIFVRAKYHKCKSFQ